MLSYQHEYHAGNFADVHKHLCLRVLFESLLKKDKPFCYIDCHAGAGHYDLQGDEARKTGEAADGIGKLWPRRQAMRQPTPAAYLDAVAALNPDGLLRQYPGSPELARQWLRPQDAALLFEIHPQALPALRRNFGRDPRFSVHDRDCHEGLLALVPPPIRRGLVLLDPSYEVKDEYQRVAGLVSRAQRRWATAIYAIWYPLLPAGRHQTLLEGLAKEVSGSVLVSEVTLGAQPELAGMFGSGMALVNPPWQTDAALADLLPEITRLLAGEPGKASLRWLVQAQQGPDDQVAARKSR